MTATARAKSRSAGGHGGAGRRREPVARELGRHRVVRRGPQAGHGAGGLLALAAAAPPPITTAIATAPARPAVRARRRAQVDRGRGRHAGVLTLTAEVRACAARCTVSASRQRPAWRTNTFDGRMRRRGVRPRRPGCRRRRRRRRGRRPAAAPRCRCGRRRPARRPGRSTPGRCRSRPGVPVATARASASASRWTIRLCAAGASRSPKPVVRQPSSRSPLTTSIAARPVSAGRRRGQGVEHLAERRRVVERLHAVEQSAGRRPRAASTARARACVGLAQCRRRGRRPAAAAGSVRAGRARRRTGLDQRGLGLATRRRALASASCARRGERRLGGAAQLLRGRRRGWRRAPPSRRRTPGSARPRRRCARPRRRRPRAALGFVVHWARVACSSASSLPRASSRAAANDWRRRSSSDMARPDIRGELRRQRGRECAVRQRNEPLNAGGRPIHLDLSGGRPVRIIGRIARRVKKSLWHHGPRRLGR